MADKLKPCLHCAIVATINDWFEQHGEVRDGRVVFDVVEAISKLQECAAEFAEMPADRSTRRRAFRFAHEALDAALKAERSGKQVAVDIPVEH